MAAKGLRGSCDSCTDAKLKCTKAKPTCARCFRRSQACIYSASKRFRRAGCAATSTARDSTNTRKTAEREEDDLPWPSGDAVGHEEFSDMDSSSALAFADLDWFDSSNKDWVEELGSVSVDHDLGSGLLMTPGTLHESENELWLADGLGHDLLPDNIVVASKEHRHEPFGTSIAGDAIPHSTPSSSFTSGGLSDNPSIPLQLLTSVTSLTTPSNPDKKTDSNSREFTSPSVSRETRPKHHCAALVLEQLAQLEIIQFGETTSSQREAERANIPPAFEHVDRVSTALKEVFERSQRHDFDTLTLLSMALFKIISWYASAVQGTMDEDTAQHPDPFGLSFSCPDMYAEGTEQEDAARIIAQQVLSKLSGIHPLISRLSQLLDENSDGHNNRTLNRSCNTLALRSRFDDDTSDTLFSAAPLRSGIEVLRNRIRELSRYITERLR